jgi:N-acetylmuramoyl-L-alanine amidase
MASLATKRLVVTLLLLSAALPCAAKTRKKPVLTPYDAAVAARTTLPTQPTRAQYDAVMDQFRAIYHANPADVHAPDSVWNVAELLATAGGKLHNTKYSQNAVGQYEFLRKNYPTSHYRAEALLAEAAIEANDLNDRAAAKAKYAELIKTYPHSDMVPDAQAGLIALKHGQHVGAATSAASTPVSAAPVAALPPSETAPSAPIDAVLPAFDKAAKRAGPPALITGIRHWSTKSYTRVAIDLSDEVQYEAARVPHPDRIYFDLHGAKLEPELAGKTFDVTDDGFLKKIRAAQFSDGVIRIVLDVNDVTDYSAFLLPNPYRLIIDIHGGAARTANGAARSVANQATAATDTTPAATDSNIAAAAAMQTNPALAEARTGTSHPSGDVALDADVAPKPAKPTASVPDTTAHRTKNTGDVASLSAQPGKVQATAAPTSKPIAATVPQSELIQEMNDNGTRGAQGGDAANVSVTPGAVSQTQSAPVSKRHGRKSKAAANEANSIPAAPAHEADPTADGQRSLARALGLKIGRVVIDAGHGGHDSGTLGYGGIEEKDVVLDVALRLGKLLKDKLGVDVIYTRSDDTFIPLETRTAIANKAQADLFISIHANSSSDDSARGVETYYLNFTSDPNALEVAARENAVSQSSVYQLSDLVKKIAMKDKIDESREFALDVESSLYAGLERGNTGLKNRGIKKAPFVVLIGANMPSILAEISFVTNPKDAAELEQPDYRERVAESLYKGVAKYANGLSGVRASTADASPDADESSADGDTRASLTETAPR